MAQMIGRSFYWHTSPSAGGSPGRSSVRSGQYRGTCGWFEVPSIRAGVPVGNVSVRHDALFVRTEVRDHRLVAAVGWAGCCMVMTLLLILCTGEDPVVAESVSWPNGRRPRK